MARDFFPNYTSHNLVLSSGATIFARQSPTSGASKPPLLLLHGYPQTHVEYHRVAPRLAEHFTVVLMDIRGYGASSLAPAAENAAPDDSGALYAKRHMAADCVEAMRALGHTGRFSVVGHDRGARVTYRMAYDMPEALERIVVLDIIPTASMFAGFGNPASVMRAYHWVFLSQPAPLPETLIGGVDGGRWFLEYCLARWTGNGSLDCFGEDALEAYRAAFCRPERIHATCDDLRAGAWVDRVHDEADLKAGNKIKVPVLAVWGNKGLFAEVMKKSNKTPLDEWSKYVENLSGAALPCGHFVTEEDPEGTVDAVLPFLLSGR